MLKHLLELMKANGGEIDATVKLSDGVRHADISVTAADEHGLVLVDINAHRIFAPWTSVVTVNVDLSE